MKGKSDRVEILEICESLGLYLDKATLCWRIRRNEGDKTILCEYENLSNMKAWLKGWRARTLTEQE